jgi:two-component system sensor histidine kinase AtoS
MARLGELTAGAAHEMGTPLAVISARCQMLAGSLADPGDRAAALAAVKAAARLNDLIARLHLIARPPKARFGAASIADIINESIQRARSANDQQESGAPFSMIRAVVPEGMPPARVDGELLGLGLAEVIRNAIESGPREAIEVRVRIDPVDDRLLIEVIDTGCGMSEHALDHAFDPFFSEKAAGRQPGLGLASAAGLVRLHDGTISLESRQGAGTTVRICIPRWRFPESSEKLAA